jgi:hypothetical protein
MFLKLYTKLHNYLWVKMYHYNKRKWDISGKPPRLLILFCYFPFPSEFKENKNKK